MMSGDGSSKSDEKEKLVGIITFPRFYFILF